MSLIRAIEGVVPPPRWLPHSYEERIPRVSFFNFCDALLIRRSMFNHNLSSSSMMRAFFLCSALRSASRAHCLREKTLRSSSSLRYNSSELFRRLNRSLRRFFLWPKVDSLFWWLMVESWLHTRCSPLATSECFCR
jgi:hypothetical protein